MRSIIACDAAGSIDFFASPADLMAIQNRSCRFGNCSKVVRLEEVGPQHGEMMLHKFGTLLLDGDAAGPKDLIVGVLELLGRLEA